MANAALVDPSETAFIDGILFGTKWATGNLTYGFPTSAGDMADYSPENALNPACFSSLSGSQQLAFKSILSQWAAVADLTFTEAAAPGNADMRVYWYQGPDANNPTARVVDFPSNEPEGGDVQLGDSVVEYALNTWDPGSYSYLTLLHEVGHALGLKHPHNALNGFPEVPADEDSIELSVMSYRSYLGAPMNGYTLAAGSYPTAPMLHDIAAIQYLYGPNWSTNSGDTTYTFDPSASVILRTIWDGGGNDTYNLSNYTTALFIDLRPGAWSDFGTQHAVLDSWSGVYSSVNLANPYLYQDDPRSLIENAIGGSGDDTLIGNQASNRLVGNAGDDALDGGTGGDDMRGGSGSDIYYVDSADDEVTENPSDPGRDTVYAEVSYSLSGRAGVEDLVLQESDALNATGNDLDNRLTGNAQDNFLDGGAGADTMAGGEGSDTYFVDSALDVIVERPGDPGVDTVFSLISYSIASSAGVENIALMGSSAIYATGNDGHNSLTGNSGANQLAGGAGNDTLNGGIGADTMDGGAGNDVFYVDNTGDIVIGSSGIDTVISTVGYKLADDVENLFAYGSSALSLTGSRANNTITGNGGANRLNGGYGDDKLAGGAGNDRLWGSYGKDILTGGSGRDVFVFDTAPNRKSNLDRIVDFNVKDDAIWLDNAVFTKLGKGTPAKPLKLSKSFFSLDKTKDKNDYLIYSKKTGYLSYDADGSGSKYKPVEVAQVKKGLALTYNDIFII